MRPTYVDRWGNRDPIPGPLGFGSNSWTQSLRCCSSGSQPASQAQPPFCSCPPKCQVGFHTGGFKAKVSEALARLWGEARWHLLVVSAMGLGACPSCLQLRSPPTLANDWLLRTLFVQVMSSFTEHLPQPFCMSQTCSSFKAKLKETETRESKDLSRSLPW